jgi:putative PIN family toxin of toxin-antitoxin system
MRLSIIDTNVLIAGMISQSSASPPVRIVDAMLSGKLLFVLSADLLKEYRCVLRRPGIQKLHRLSDQQIDIILTDITANSIFLGDIAKVQRQAPDPGDNHLWALHYQRPEALLVTGDRLLLEANEAYGLVISPADFCSVCGFGS